MKISSLQLWVVYALYQRDIGVAFYLCTLVTIEIVLGVRGIVITFKNGVFRSNGCDGKGAPQEVFYWFAGFLIIRLEELTLCISSGCALLSQFSLWYMTYARRNIVPGVVPVLRVMARDGFCAFVVLCGRLEIFLLGWHMLNLHSSVRLDNPVFHCIRILECPHSL